MRKINIGAVLIFILAFSLLFITGCSEKEKTAVVGEESKLSGVVGSDVESEKTEQKLECPRGMEHDPAPGLCGMYIDENKDGYCDYE